MLNKEDKVGCYWCSEVSTAENWNNATYSECTSREMRRAYTPIFNEKTFTESANTFYKCPLCGKWTRGSNLTWARAPV